jgi:hypothetical protein
MLGARPGLVAGLLVKMEKGDRFSRPEKTGLPECGLRVRQTPPRETDDCNVAFHVVPRNRKVNSVTLNGTLTRAC